MSVPELDGEKRAVAKIRYNHRGDECVLRMLKQDLIEVTFDRPQRAPTPGQAVVFYDGDYVLGGGTIV
jgi:tRNA-specific 2-thiouridylase